ncbi:uncharacterized protein marchf1 isoform X1 [Solea solea]|uniref:uncharacterized protein marchf1 isoform X1 n=1 Tax=Solea solea TaxID=90069 RepID=UPI002729DFE9|nr:uncharacterized protein marchf1 isoform X1 [Solea solea]XP_058496450.1 uncharacterized protein marchf1 isoform X1 [Solea solea]
MPVQQITVVPPRDAVSNGKSVPSSKDKNEGRKAAGRSGSRSSNISKASNSTTGLNTTSRASVTPSSQDICSQLMRLEEDASETHKHSKHTRTSERTVTSKTMGSSAHVQKKPVKRCHRRRRSSCAATDCVETISKQEQTDRSDRSLSSDRSEKGEKREQSFKIRRELPPRLRCTGAPQSDSSSENEMWRDARSWSKEKARRVHRCNRNSREKDGANRNKGSEDKTEIMELQSVVSDEGTEKLPLEEDSDGLDRGMEERPLVEDSGGLKKRHSSQSSMKRDDHTSQREVSQSRDKEKSYKSHDPGGSSSQAEYDKELTTKRYQEKGLGGGDTSAPTPQTHCSMNGDAPQLCSEDSEEVCRICHCEGEDEFPLIMPCRCTGSLSFVHQSCLNQWIKSSDTRCCELCKFDFVMETKLKPLSKWEKLHMSKSERRKIFCSVLFHLIAIVCMLWSIYILVKRTTEEIRLGKNDEIWRVTLLKYYSEHAVLEWPFWTKLIVVGIGFTGGLIFMYIQCKVYMQLWRRLKAFNRIITVQNCPEKDPRHSQTQSFTISNGRREAVEVPVSPVVSPVVSPAPILAPQAQTDSDMSVEDAVAPV